MSTHRFPEASAEPGALPGLPRPPAFQLALEASFGTVAHWRRQFSAPGRQVGVGPGRLMLVFHPGDGRLVNRTGDPTQAVAGGVWWLALDIGPGLDEPGAPPAPGAAAGAGVDVDRLLGRTDWAAVHARCQQAVLSASEPFGAGLDETAGTVPLDVRRTGPCETGRKADPTQGSGAAAVVRCRREHRRLPRAPARRPNAAA